MGKPNPSADDMATAVITGNLSSVTAGSAIIAPTDRVLNVNISGTFSATLQLERSFDGGATWIGVSRDVVGTVATYTSPSSFQVRETESGVLYRLSMTARTSGTAAYRLSY